MEFQTQLLLLKLLRALLDVPGVRYGDDLTEQLDAEIRRLTDMVAGANAEPRP